MLSLVCKTSRDGKHVMEKRRSHGRAIAPAPTSTNIALLAEGDRTRVDVYKHCPLGKGSLTSLALV